MSEILSLFQNRVVILLIGVFICILGFILVVRVACVAVRIVVFILGISLILKGTGILRGTGFGRYADALFSLCQKTCYYVWDQFISIISNIT